MKDIFIYIGLLIELAIVVYFCFIDTDNNIKSKYNKKTKNEDKKHTNKFAEQLLTEENIYDKNAPELSEESDKEDEKNKPTFKLFNKDLNNDSAKKEESLKNLYDSNVESEQRSNFSDENTENYEVKEDEVIFGSVGNIKKKHSSKKIDYDINEDDFESFDDKIGEDKDNSKLSAEDYEDDEIIEDESFFKSYHNENKKTSKHLNDEEKEEPTHKYFNYENNEDNFNFLEEEKIEKYRSKRNNEKKF